MKNKFVFDDSDRMCKCGFYNVLDIELEHNYSYYFYTINIINYRLSLLTKTYTNYAAFSIYTYFYKYMYI